MQRLPREAGEGTRLLDDLGERPGHALGSVEDGELVHVLERGCRCGDDLRELLGDLLRDDRLLVLAHRGGAALDACGLGLHPGADGVRLGEALRLDGVSLGLPGETGGVRLSGCLHLERRCCGLSLHLGLRRDGLGAEPDLLRLGLGLADAHVAPCGGERRLPVCLGVGGTAHVDLELLLLLLAPAARQPASAR